jgi:hypothetical protein
MDPNQARTLGRFEPTIHGFAQLSMQRGHIVGLGKDPCAYGASEIASLKCVFDDEVDLGHFGPLTAA